MKLLTKKANLTGAIASIFGVGMLLGINVPPSFVLAYGLIIALYGIALAFIIYAKDLNKKKKQRAVNTECVISQYRQNRNMSIEQLAELVNIAPETVRKIEGNKYSPSLELAQKLAAVFNVTTDSLFKPVTVNNRKGAVVNERANV